MLIIIGHSSLYVSALVAHYTEKHSPFFSPVHMEEPQSGKHPPRSLPQTQPGSHKSWDTEPGWVSAPNSGANSSWEFSVSKMASVPSQWQPLLQELLQHPTSQILSGSKPHRVQNSVLLTFLFQRLRRLTTVR